MQSSKKKTGLIWPQRCLIINGKRTDIFSFSSQRYMIFCQLNLGSYREIIKDGRKISHFEGMSVIIALKIIHYENKNTIVPPPWRIHQFCPFDDLRVNIAESNQMVDALKKRNIAVEYMVKDNEGHGFHNEENRFDFYRAIEKFLGTHLK